MIPERNSALLPTRMIIRGVIFDMDGTITAPSIDFDGMRAAAGIPAGTDILEYVTAATGAEADRLRAVMQRFEDGAAARAELNPGARELLDFLENGCPFKLWITQSIGVITSFIKACCRGIENDSKTPHVGVAVFLSKSFFGENSCRLEFAES